MDLKLDENLGASVAELLRQVGHDVATVLEESLCASTDDHLIEVCRQERRCLVTLDKDFSNPIRFRPSDYAGIVVLRLPRRSSHADLIAAVRTLLQGLSCESVEGKLWTVQQDRVRIYQEESAGEEA